MAINDLNQQYPDKEKWPIFSDSTEIKTATADSNVFETTCEIPSSLSYFAGHFPDQAVLPGVVQVNWANNLATKLFNVKEFRGVNSLKFNTMILPEAKVALSLTLNPEKHTVKFSYKSDSTLFSSGILAFASNRH